jgi:hypothetical protein
VKLATNELQTHVQQATASAAPTRDIQQRMQLFKDFFYANRK